MEQYKESGKDYQVGQEPKQDIYQSNGQERRRKIYRQARAKAISEMTVLRRVLRKLKKERLENKLNE